MHRNLPFYVINPDSRFIAAWDLLTSLCLIFTAVVTPWEVGFGEAPTSYTDPMYVINRCIDGIFVLDMVKEFLMAYKTSTKAGAAVESRWETRLPKIALRYARGWLTLDVASIVPSCFELKIDTSSEGAGAAKSLRVVRTF